MAKAFKPVTGAELLGLTKHELMTLALELAKPYEPEQFRRLVDWVKRKRKLWESADRRDGYLMAQQDKGAP